MRVTSVKKEESVKEDKEKTTATSGKDGECERPEQVNRPSSDADADVSARMWYSVEADLTVVLSVRVTENQEAHMHKSRLLHHQPMGITVLALCNPTI